MGVFEKFARLGTWSVLLMLVTLIAFKIGLIIRNIKKKHRDVVLSKSRKIKAVDALNERMSFYKIDDVRISYECAYVEEFDEFDYRKYLKEHGKENNELMYTLYGIQKNRKLDIQYGKEFYDILSSVTSYDDELYRKYKYFESIEQDVCEERKLSPTIETAIKITKHFNDNYEMMVIPASEVEVILKEEL